jgi:ATP-dependent DNA ligase
MYYYIVIFRVLCKNNSHLEDMISTITENGGEGIILRKMYSLYENGRSSHLVKFKVFLSLSLYFVFFENNP